MAEILLDREQGTIVNAILICRSSSMDGGTQRLCSHLVRGFDVASLLPFLFSSRGLGHEDNPTISYATAASHRGCPTSNQAHQPRWHLLPVLLLPKRLRPPAALRQEEERRGRRDVRRNHALLLQAHNFVQLIESKQKNDKQRNVLCATATRISSLTFSVCIRGVYWICRCREALETDEILQRCLSDPIRRRHGMREREGCNRWVEKYE